MRVTLIIVFALITHALNAQLKEGKKNIENLCGCYQVEFKYAETFSPDAAYKFHDREKINGGLELIIPIENTDRKIVLQHLLVVNDKVIVKHWREDWVYEPTDILKYEADYTWKKEKLNNADVKGKWLQTVWEVSEAPRYQGYGEWLNIEGEQVWQNTTDAPLPRREYSVRNDYNILNRTNRIRITKEGWIHEQDNRKIIRNNGNDQLLAEEKGWNTYVKVDDSKCAAALNYWKNTSEYWSAVKQVWNNFINDRSVVKINAQVNGRDLHAPLFGLANEFASGTLPKENLVKAVSNIMKPYLVSSQPGN